MTGVTRPAFTHLVTEHAELEGLFTPPAAMVARKKIDHLDAGAAALIAASPLVLLGTAGPGGHLTVSPRGGEPGFVRVLDPGRLVLPDAAGNRLLDSAHNLLADPRVGLLFVLPGRTWSLRVSGLAHLTRDPELAGETGLAVGVEVRDVFVHCGRAFELGQVWDPSSWPGPEVADAREVFRGHVALNSAPEDS